MNENILTEFDETTRDLLKTISSFSQEQFNSIPFEGSWTAGQVSEHLLKSNSGIQEILTGNTKPTERKPDENEAVIRSIFLDFSTKMQSAEIVFPSNEPKGKETLLKAMEAICAKIKKVITSEDLSPTCADFPFPELGEFTKYEWVCFVISHTKRHTRQMKNIYEKLRQL